MVNTTELVVHPERMFTVVGVILIIGLVVFVGYFLWQLFTNG